MACACGYGTEKLTLDRKFGNVDLCDVWFSFTIHSSVKLITPYTPVAVVEGMQDHGLRVLPLAIIYNFDNHLVSFFLSIEPTILKKYIISNWSKIATTNILAIVY